DADKLDIWKVVLDYYHTRGEHRNKVLELGLPDEPGYSQKILQALHEHRIALVLDLETLNDFKLLQIGWVFDLNFTPSFQAVQKYKYIQQIAATLPQSKEIAAAVKEAEAYVKLKAEG
ncbi:MAG: HD family phosphohydrolase, partial [Deltaproteobacteria bacterium]|nr:HD family phosphohydrolase [Deltaproteobacteria bacterium]